MDFFFCCYIFRSWDLCCWKPNVSSCSPFPYLENNIITQIWLNPSNILMYATVVLLFILTLMCLISVLFLNKIRSLSLASKSPRTFIYNFLYITPVLVWSTCLLFQTIIMHLLTPLLTFCGCHNIIFQPSKIFF